MFCRLFGFLNKKVDKWWERGGQLRHAPTIEVIC